MYEDHDRRHDTESRERISALETELRLMAVELKEMASDMRIIRDTLSQARGGWKVMMMVGGSAGVFGAFVGKWLAIMVNGAPK